MLSAQTPSGVTQRRATPATSRQLTPATVAGITPNGNGALVMEMAGASIGSLAGIGTVALAKRCGIDDLGCQIITAGAAGVAGVVGATIGTMLTARATGSRRSVIGAALGGVLGTGVGLGVHCVLNQGTDVNLDGARVIPIFVLSQGIFAALGSRFGATTRIVD